MNTFLKKTNLIFKLTILSIIFSGCAQVPLKKITTSGKPERVFTNAKIVDIKSKIIERCAIKGSQVEERGTNTIICTKMLDNGDAILAQMLVGNSYSSTPEQKLSFVVTQRNNDVFVIINSMWIESQMAFGRINRVELMDDHKNLNNLQSSLDEL